MESENQRAMTLTLASTYLWIHFTHLSSHESYETREEGLVTDKK